MKPVTKKERALVVPAYVTINSIEELNYINLRVKLLVLVVVPFMLNAK
jgi:hypothetical protein